MSETRTARVGDQIQREIASLLTTGALKDDRIGFVTITGVKVTEDITEAKVYYVSHGTDAEQMAVSQALAENAGRIRSLVARAMRLRHMPSLRFVYDQAIEEGAKIDRLLQEVRKKEGW